MKKLILLTGFILAANLLMGQALSSKCPCTEALFKFTCFNGGSTEKVSTRLDYQLGVYFAVNYKTYDIVEVVPNYAGQLDATLYKSSDAHSIIVYYATNKTPYAVKVINPNNQTILFAYGQY